MGEQGSMGFIGPKGSRGTTGFVVHTLLFSMGCLLQNHIFNVLRQSRQPKRHEKRKRDIITNAFL